MPRQNNRIALVVGIGEYELTTKLKNPSNDAADISTVLKRNGFKVIELVNQTNIQIEKALNKFCDLLPSHEVGLFFFAGHGFEHEGKNYLVAKDTNISDAIEAKHSSISLDYVIEKMVKANPNTNIIILDACRNSPFLRSWGRTTANSLASVYVPKGTLIAYATSPGEVASDGAGRNGAYTDALLKHIETPDLPIETMFKRARNTLSLCTNKKQTSWEHTSLAGDFYFNLGIAKIITEYSVEALRDGNFMSVNRDGQELIGKMKSYNWYRQNPAIEKINGALASALDTDTVFVIGRNIYQAAVGSSGSALVFIEQFANKTIAWDKANRKAVLDGMLFEIFFNKDGELRTHFKMTKFEEVFKLQDLSSFKNSFEFISSCLVPHQDLFYILAGKKQVLNLDVDCEEFEDKIYVRGIFYGGNNILKLEDANFEGEYKKDSFHYKSMRKDQIIELLAEQAICRMSQINLTFNVSDTGIIKFPRFKSISRKPK